MTAPGGRGEPPSPSIHASRRRQSISVSDLMDGADRPSPRRRTSDFYPSTVQHIPPHGHNVRAASPSAGALAQPPPHHAIPPSYPYRRGHSPDREQPRVGSSSSNPRQHPPPYLSHAPLYDSNPNHPQHDGPAPLVHRDRGDDFRARDYDRPPPFDRRGLPAEHVDSDDRRPPYRHEYSRDYPDRPPLREFPSPPPPPQRGTGAVNASGSAPSHEPPPLHTYPPIPARGPPGASQTPAAAETSYVSGAPVTTSPSGTARSPSLAADTHRGPSAHLRSPLPLSGPPPLNHSRARPERDDLAHGHPTPPQQFQSSQPRTFFTPAPRYSTKGLSPNDVPVYNRGWNEAMEAVQQGVVWIDGTAYSQIPMFIPEADRPDRGGPPDLGRDHFTDPNAPGDRGYGREPPPSSWDAGRGGRRDELASSYAAPSRSHSAPVAPRMPPGYGPPDGYYRPKMPYPQYPGQMEPGPLHYPVQHHMPGPPMPPQYMGHDPYGAPYGYGMPPHMRPAMQSQQLRSRQQISCHPCRNRKVKCSGTTPCEACIKIKREHECQYEKTVRRRGKGKKAGTTGEGETGFARDKGEEGQRGEDRSDGEQVSGDERRRSNSRWNSTSPELSRDQRDRDRDREPRNHAHEPREDEGDRKPHPRERERDREQDRGRERRESRSEREHDRSRDRENDSRDRERTSKRHRSRSRSPARRVVPAPPAARRTSREGSPSR